MTETKATPAAWARDGGQQTSNRAGGDLSSSIAATGDTTCKTLHVVIGPRNTSWCSGTPAVRPLLRQLDVPTMWDRERKAWAIPTNRLDDVLCAAEYRQRRFVTITEVDR